MAASTNARPAPNLSGGGRPGDHPEVNLWLRHKSSIRNGIVGLPPSIAVSETDSKAFKKYSLFIIENMKVDGKLVYSHKLHEVARSETPTKDSLVACLWTSASVMYKAAVRSAGSPCTALIQTGHEREKGPCPNEPKSTFNLLAAERLSRPGGEGFELIIRVLDDHVLKFIKNNFGNLKFGHKNLTEVVVPIFAAYASGTAGPNSLPEQIELQLRQDLPWINLKLLTPRWCDAVKSIVIGIFPRVGIPGVDVDDEDVLLAREGEFWGHWVCHPDHLRPQPCVYAKGAKLLRSRWRARWKPY
ncbi:hypothetical protein DFJ74DRAFT_666390 [Hyaloraphidium curvatum]|nr:hypothetical protein DFJ74DRAFT_666390 [Hyaloraphidium curvatum]